MGLGLVMGRWWLGWSLDMFISICTFS
jgi:hypothetical protein